MNMQPSDEKDAAAFIDALAKASAATDSAPEARSTLETNIATVWSNAASTVLPPAPPMSPRLAQLLEDGGATGNAEIIELDFSDLNHIAAAGQDYPGDLPPTGQQ